MSNKKIAALSGITLGTVLLLAVSVSIVREVIAQTTDVKTPSPPPFKYGIMTLNEKSWDFGYIPKGSRVTHTFIIKNTGEDSLKNLKARPSCGCTAAPLEKTTLMPGDSTFLEVTFNAKNFNGPVTKTIYLESNDPNNPFIDLVFTANVGAPIPNLSLTPQDVSFDTIKTLTNDVKKILIKNINSDLKLSLSMLYPPKPWVAYKMRKKSIRPGQELELEVRLKQEPKAGEFFTSMTLICDDPNKSRFTIPIHGVFLASK